MSERDQLIEKIHAEIEKGDVKAVTSLLQTAGPLASQVLSTPSKTGYTALYLACMRRCAPPLLQLLLKSGPTIDVKGDDKETPLYIATHNNLVQHVQLLLSAGAQVNELNGIDGETALHAAARFGFVDVADALIKAGANINMRNVRMETPLFVAAKYGKHDVAYLLLNLDANRNLTNEDGKNPLFIASERGHKHVVHLLKVEKPHLRDAKAQADVELKMLQPSLPTTEELIARAAKKAKEEAENEAVLTKGGHASSSVPGKKKPETAVAAQPLQDLTPLPITKIEIPETIVRTHDPLTGKPIGPCKTLEQAGYRGPPEIPKGLKIKPLSDEQVGGTMMAVGTGTGIKVRTPALLSQLPDADVVDFGSAVVVAKKK